ncbi:ParB/RepB/Spo0J family partition protein, partial [Moritella viscosa]
MGAKNFKSDRLAKKKAKNESLVDLVDESKLVIKKGEQILKMPISEIYSTTQVRTKFPEDKILQIGNSMLKNGQFSPIVVFPEDPKGYKVHQGECRYLGAKAVGLEFIDIVVRGSGDVFTQIAENIHRIKLDPFDISKSLNEVKAEKGLTSKQLADSLGYSESKIKKILPLFNAPDFIKSSCVSGDFRGDVESINYLIKIAKIDEQQAASLIINGANRKELKDILNHLKAPSNIKSDNNKNTAPIETLVTEIFDEDTKISHSDENINTSHSDENINTSYSDENINTSYSDENINTSY